MELDISYNWLGDNSGCSFAVILQKCPLLNTLRIESCGLTSQVFALGKEFPVALKGIKVINLQDVKLKMSSHVIIAKVMYAVTLILSCNNENILSQHI